MGLWCIGGCGGSGAALRQEQKCSTGGKAAGGGICGARHGGIIYWLRKIKISLEKKGAGGFLCFSFVEKFVRCYRLKYFCG